MLMAHDAKHACVGPPLTHAVVCERRRAQASTLGKAVVRVLICTVRVSKRAQSVLVLLRRVVLVARVLLRRACAFKRAMALILELIRCRLGVLAC